MSPQIIKLLVSLLALLIIGIQVMFGAIRGLKKSVFRLVWIFAWGVICLLISSLIAKALVNINISFLHLQVNGELISTFPEYIQKTLEASNPDIAQAFADNPQLYELCVQVAVSIINLVVFEVLFWVVKYLMYPVWAILARVFFKKAKKNVSPAKENVYIKSSDSKPKKHRLLGMLIGVASGIIVVMFAFIPLKTISDLALMVEAETTVEYDGATQKGLVSQYAGDYVDYIYIYEDSIVNQALKYTGIGYVQNLGGDILINTKYNGKGINLKNEVKLFGNAYVDFEKIRQFDISNLTQEDIEIILPLADDMQSKVLSSGLVQSVYEVAPYFVKNMLTDDAYFIKFPDLGNDTFNTMLRQTARTVFGITDADEIDETKLTQPNEIKSDISKVIALAQELNEEDIIAKILNKTMTFEIAQQKITVQIADDVVECLFNLNLTNKLVPVLFEPGLEHLISLVPSVEYDSTETNIEFTGLEGGIETENLKEFLKTSMANVVGVFKNIDTESSIYIDPNDFSKVGAIIDGLKLGTVISTDTFDSGINYLSTFAKKLISGAGLDTEYENFVITLADKIGGIGSYELEFNYVSNAYNVYSEAETVDLDVIKEVFDELLPSYIYTSSKDEIFGQVIDRIDDINFGDLDIKDDIIDQLEQDKDDNVNIISIIIQLQDLGADINEIRNVPELADIDRAYLVELGNLIDNMSTKYSLIINSNIERKMGEYVAELICDKVPNTSEYKAAVEITFNNMDNYDSFETMFEQYADDLNLA